jgi:dTDP-3-amino-3,4,6-trideoxy-alpha-D-glucose transaminase
MPKRLVPFYDTKTIPMRHRKMMKKAIGKCFDVDRLIDGDELTIFESNFAEYIGSKFAVGVANGLDAITISLRALGIGPGDKVAVPAHTFIATWLAVHATGATPVGVDVDIFGQMDLGLLEREVGLKCVIVVHMHGRSCDLVRLTDWAKRNNVFVVEDCAQAHGLVVSGKKVGSWGDISAFSFYPTKNLFALGDGGAVTTSSQHLHDRVRSISRYGRIEGDKYRHNLDGVNSRLDTIQAGVLNYGLSQLDSWNHHRTRIANLYLSNLNYNFPAGKYENSVHHHFDLILEDRNFYQAELLKYGVTTEIHYPILAADEAEEMNELKYTTARSIAQKTLSLPMSPWQKDKDTFLVIEAFNSISM